jgi:hypothetical protein
MEDDSLIPALNPVTDPVDPENPQIQIPRYPVGQDITCYGEPTLSNGFDRGYGDMTQSRKMQALHFNRPNSPTRFGEYMQVLDQAVDQPNKTLRVTDASVGQTWIIRIKSTDTFNPQPTGSYSQTLISKIDADDGNNAVLIYLGSSGRCVFQIRKAGVDYAVYHADVYPAIGTEYEYALVWNPAGATTNDKMHIYLNGVLKTNTNNTPTSYGDATKHDLYIGRRGGYNDGYFTGNIILVKYFHNFLATDANILSHYNNKLTIADGITYGHVAVINYMTPQNS